MFNETCVCGRIRLRPYAVSASIRLSIALREPTMLFEFNRSPEEGSMPARCHSAVGASSVQDFLPGIDLAYWWRGDAQRTWLHCAAVLRVASASRWVPADSDRLRPPDGFGLDDCGIVIGPYALRFDEAHEELRVGGERLLSLRGRNVVLLTGSQGSLQVAGTDLIAGDLGGPEPAVADDATGQVSDRYLQWVGSMHQRLSALLQSSPATRAFLASQRLA